MWENVPFHVMYSVSTQNDSHSRGCFVEGMNGQCFFVSTSTDYEHDHVLRPEIWFVKLSLHTNKKLKRFWKDRLSITPVLGDAWLHSFTSQEYTRSCFNP